MEAGNYRLADSPVELKVLAGVMTDLRIVREMLQHCITTEGGIHSDCEELEEACWTTAALRYERCFSNRAWSYKEIVEAKLTQEQLVSHHFFRFLRDKMFSHALGVGEDFEVTAFVFTNHLGVLQLGGLGPRPRRICSPGEDLASEFLALANVVSELVVAHFNARRDALLARLCQLPVTSVVKGRPVEQVALDFGKDDPEFKKYVARALATLP